MDLSEDCFQGHLKLYPTVDEKVSRISSFHFDKVGTPIHLIKLHGNMKQHFVSGSVPNKRRRYLSGSMALAALAADPHDQDPEIRKRFSREGDFSDRKEEYPPTYRGVGQKSDPNRTRFRSDVGLSFASSSELPIYDLTWLQLGNFMLKYYHHISQRFHTAIT